MGESQQRLLSPSAPRKTEIDHRPSHTMDAPSLPEWTRFTSASTLGLAEAELAQYKANARWMSAIIAVMKERGEPPAQSPKQSSPAFSRTAVPACSPAPCSFCGHSPELAFFRREGSSATKRPRQPNSDTEPDTVTDPPSQPTQGTPTRQHLPQASKTLRRADSGRVQGAARGRVQGTAQARCCLLLPENLLNSNY